VPQIQEPDERFWTLLRVMFVTLVVAGVVFLASRMFVADPPSAPGAAHEAAPAVSFASEPL